jgi:signal transduction histidine kinase
MTSAATTMISGARRTQVWLREHPRFVDVLFAGLMALLALADFSGQRITDQPRDADMVGVVLVVIAASSLAWRRVAPIPVLAFVIGISCVFYERDYGSFMAVVGLASIYAVVAHGSNRRAVWISLGIGIGVLFGVASFTLLDGIEGFRWSGAVGMSTSIGATVFAATVIRYKDEIFADTKQRAELAEADRKSESERAVARERLRIAREMHDVVAHGMSLITVQAAAAQEIVITRPDDAARLMQSVESTGRDALAEMRRMLGVLRNNDSSDATDEPAALAPQPSLADLESTIAHCRDAGTPTELTVSGHQRPLPPGIELAAFRVVQEALTNVMKHGGNAAMASVELNYKVDELQIKISDTGRGAVSGLNGDGGGHGHIGMRERVEIYDGRLVAGPRPGGGYQVDASLPISVATQHATVRSSEPQNGPPT